MHAAMRYPGFEVAGVSRTSSRVRERRFGVNGFDSVIDRRGRLAA